MKKVFISIIFLIMHCCLFAQQNYNDLPLSAVLHLSSNIYTVELQKPDVNKLLLQDEKNAENGKPMRNGYVYSVDYDLNNSGTISYLCEGGKLWRITIKAEGAKFLACSLENLSFTDGAKLYLYNRERTGFFNYSNENLKEQSKLFSPQIPGDEITIEYYEPGGIQFQTDLKISKIVYYYK